MSQEHAPDDFDWVAAQAKCSAASMFARLQAGVNEDVERRNGLIGRDDGWKFEFMFTWEGRSVAGDWGATGSIIDESLYRSVQP
jgi:hypothetical protein